MNTTTPQILNPFSMIRFCLPLAGAIVALAQLANAQTPLPIYEPFPTSYTNGTADETVPVPAVGPNSYPARRIRNSPTTTVWSIGGSAGGGSPLAVGGPAVLSYPGLYQDGTPSVGAWIRTNLTSANRTAGILFPTINSGSVYASFLMNIEKLPATTNRCFVKFETATTGTGSVGGSGAAVGVHLTPEGNLAVSKSSTTVAGATNATVLSAGTHLVVVRYTWNAGADDDEVALWLDPGSLNAPAGSEPAPAVTLLTGTDLPSISSFYIQAPQNGPPQVPAGIFLDEIRIATNWSGVTPTQALCTAVSIVTAPTNQTVIEGLSATFTVVAGGTSPTFQWQLSTNNGTTWNNVSAGIGGTSQAYLTPPTALANSGNRYRVIANVSCNNSSATSAPVTLTVAAAVKTPNGVVLDDSFADFGYNNIPLGSSNSVWLQSTASTLDASSGTYLLATSQSSSVAWVGYFTDDPTLGGPTNLPVHLDVGKALKVTMVFKGNNIVANNGNFRIGLFDYQDSGISRPAIDGSTVANSGVGVRGYMATFNYGQTFTGNPFSLYARNNLVADLMGTTGNFLNLGGGPANYSGASAFQNGVNYTAVFTISRKAVTNIDFTVNVSGGGTNWVYTHEDTSYCYPRFDAIAIRPASAATAADSFEISHLLVEVVTATPSAIPLNIASSGGNVTLTWSDASFKLQAAPDVTGTYTNVPNATSPYPVSPSDNRKFFRLVYP